MNVAMGCSIRDQVKSLDEIETHLDEIKKLEKFSVCRLSPERAKSFELFFKIIHLNDEPNVFQMSGSA